MKSKYLLLGLGVGNLSVMEYLDSKKIEYSIYDDNLKEYKKDIDFNRFNIVIKSSGVEDNHYILKYAKLLKKKIITDLEFFYINTIPKKIITVTGSNGKTTTVSLIHHVLTDLDLGGNIGIPLAKFIDSKNDIIIEASSFMLDYIDTFTANISVFTNIFLNHLDHHKTIKKYVRAKLKLIKNIKSQEYLIYNYDDLLLKRLFKYLYCKKMCFSLESKEADIYLDGSNVYYKNEIIWNIKDVKLLGLHNKYNILAAIAAILAYDERKKDHFYLLNSFNGIEHRIEYIGCINNINIYNDSKSTNFSALKIALNTFKDEKILLICGGKLKEDNIKIIEEELKQIEFVIINGENHLIYSKIFKENNVNFIVVQRLEDAVKLVKNYLKNITVILFSPGSSSYDQFQNFEARGKFFKELMNKYYELKM